MSATLTTNDDERALDHGLPRVVPPQSAPDLIKQSPLVKGDGERSLAEFVCGGLPLESSPFDPSRERYSVYALEADALPEMYWNGMPQERM